MNTNTHAQGELAQETAAAHNNIEAVDALTDAVVTGEAPADIQRLEAAAGADAGHFDGGGAGRVLPGDGGLQRNGTDGAYGTDGSHGGYPGQDAADAAFHNPDAVDAAHTGRGGDASPEGGALREATGAALDDQHSLPGSAEGDGRGLPKKVRLGGEDMAVALLRKSRPDLSWADAERLVLGGAADGSGAENGAYRTHETYKPYGDDTQTGGAQGEPAPAARRVEALTQHLAAVQAQLDAAAQEAARQQQPQPQQLPVEQEGDVRSLSLQTANHLYPELAMPETALWREAHRIATDPAHPDHHPDILGSPNAPLLIAKIAAANLGRGAAAQPSPGAWAVASSVPQYGQAGAVRPASGVRSTVPPPPKLTTQEALRASEAATLEAVESGGNARATAPERPYMLM